MRDDPIDRDATPDAPTIVTGALRARARWLYCQLQTGYDHLVSDDVVDEILLANTYTFTAAGQRFG